MSSLERGLLWGGGGITIWGIHVDSVSQPLFYVALPLLASHLHQLPWFVLAALSAVAARPRVWANGRRSYWVLWAAAWSFSSAVVELVEWQPLQRLITQTGPLDVPAWMVLECGLPLLCGVWLLLGTRLLWVVPLVLGLFSLDALVVYLKHWVPAVRCADGSWGLVLNEAAFDSLFVWPVELAGPWLAIAWWAWRYPARAPADDGTLLPRRHCANCLYNLQGLSSDRCPECGASLGSPGEVGEAVRRPVLSTADG